MGLLKLLSANEIVAQVISFLVLLILLRIFLWKRFLTILESRKERIASEFKNIEDMKSNLAKQAAGYEDKLRAIEETAKARIEDAIVEGNRIAAQIKENAGRESQKMITNARDMIETEIGRAREELRDEIVDIAISAAGKVIEEKLTESENRKLVEDFLKRVEKTG